VALNAKIQRRSGDQPFESVAGGVVFGFAADLCFFLPDAAFLDFVVFLVMFMLSPDAAGAAAGAGEAAGAGVEAGGEVCA